MVPEAVGLLGRIQTHAKCRSTEQEEKQASSLVTL